MKDRIAPPCRNCGEALDIYQPPETRFCSEVCEVDFFDRQRGIPAWEMASSSELLAALCGAEIEPKRTRREERRLRNSIIVLIGVALALFFWVRL